MTLEELDALVIAYVTKARLPVSVAKTTFEQVKGQHDAVIAFSHLRAELSEAVEILTSAAEILPVVLEDRNEAICGVDDVLVDLVERVRAFVEKHGKNRSGE
jgi:hypothetical protein